MLVFRNKISRGIEVLKGSTDIVGQVVGERVPARVQEKPSWHGLSLTGSFGLAPTAKGRFVYTPVN